MSEQDPNQEIDNETQKYISQLESNVKKDKNDWESRITLIEYLLSYGKNDEASTLLNSTPELPADNDGIKRTSLAFAYTAPLKGVDYLDQVLEFDKENAIAKIEKARMLGYLGQADKALKIYFETIEKKPELAEPELGKQLLDLSNNTNNETDTAPQNIESNTENPTSINNQTSSYNVQNNKALNIDTNTSSFALPKEKEQFTEEKKQTVEKIPAQNNLNSTQNYSNTTNENEQIPQSSEENITKQEIGKQVGENDEYFYPVPGSFPTMSAKKIVRIAPLIDPKSLPDKESLEYQRDVSYIPANYTSNDELKEIRKPVYVNKNEEEILVDYEHPEQIETHADPDNINVVAKQTDDGKIVAPAPEILLDPKKARLKNAERKKKGRYSAILYAILAHIIIGILLLFVVISLPEKEEPIITVINPSEIPNDAIDPQEITEMATAEPTASMPTPPMISANTTSDFNVPDVEVDIEAEPTLGIDSVEFGEPIDTVVQTNQQAASFFGEKVKGNLGIVFDISISAIDFLPNVMYEIKTKFPGTPIYCISSLTVRNPKRPEAISFKSAKEENSMAFRVAKMDKAIKNRRKDEQYIPIVRDLLKKWPKAYTSGTTYDTNNLGNALRYLEKRGADEIYVFSDFQVSAKKRLKEVENLIKKLRGVKVNLHVLGPQLPKGYSDIFSRIAKETGGKIYVGRIKSVKVQAPPKEFLNSF